MLIDLFIDIAAKKLVASKTNTTPIDSMAPFTREDAPNLRITLLRPNPIGGLSDRYNVVDITALGLRAGMGDFHGPRAGQPIALQTVWAKDLEAHTFTGRLGLDTVAIRNMLKESEDGKISSTFEVEVLEDGYPTTVLKKTIILEGDVIRSESVDPDVVLDISAFANAMAQVLTNTNTIVLVQQGNEIHPALRMKPGGGITSDAQGAHVDATVSREGHTHEIEDVNGLGNELLGKADAGTAHDPVSIADPRPNILPIFSANNVPVGYLVSASQEITPAWHAFDQSLLTAWSATTPQVDPECACAPGHEPHIWLALALPDLVMVTGYTVYGALDPAQSPKKWYLQASNDGLLWTILHSAVDQTGWGASAARRFEIEHSEAYLHYRLFIVEGNGDAAIAISEVEFEDQCQTIELTLQGQTLNAKLRMAPGGGLECGPGGARVVFPDATLPEDEGRVIRTIVAPNVTKYPKFANYIWINPMNPPTINVWNSFTKEWINSCEICGTAGGGYVAKLPLVEFDPPTGAATPVTVALSVPGQSVVEIFYTLDGSVPSVDVDGLPEGTTQLYSTPIELANATTIKAFARKEGWFNSDVSEAEYGPVAVPAWLLNINFAESGSAVKKGGAAVVETAFEDFWTQVTQTTTARTNLRLANNSFSGVDLTAGNLFFTGAIPNADPMFATYLYQTASTESPDGRIGVSLTKLPVGVYDLYLYGHGSLNAEKAIFSVRAGGVELGIKSTATSGWNTTDWANSENKNYVVFRNIELTEIRTILVTCFQVEITGLGLPKPWISLINGLQLVKRSKVTKPVFNPPSGYQFSNTISVQISNEQYPTAEIRYTTDGSAPDETSTLYAGPVELSATTTIKAIAVLAGFESSVVAEATYTKL